jgi:hypothetical protein
MWPYWLLFLLTAFGAVRRLQSTSVIAMPVHHVRWTFAWRGLLVLLVLMIGFRHEVGGDWFPYFEDAQRMTGTSVISVFSEKDAAFGMFNWLAAQSGAGVYLVNLLSAVIFSWGLLSFCRAQPRPWLALVVAVPYLITVVAMGYTRQGVAIGIAMLGMVALGQGRIFRFMLWIALAAVFHKSAIILIPLATLANTKRRFLTVLWVAVAGFALFALLLQESLDYFERGYIEAQYQSSGAAIRIAMNAVPAVLFLIFRKRFQLTRQESSFWALMSWSALVFIALLTVSPSSTAVDRVALYWIPVQLFVLSRLPNALGLRNGKNAVWVYAVVGYSATVQFVWLVYADTAFAWLPYQFYPWVWLWK